MSVLDLLQVQVATEATWGTPIVPTARLMGIDEISLTPVYQTHVLPDFRASLAPGYLVVLEKAEGAGKVGGWCTYEDILYFLDNAFGQATPGGVGPYTRAYVGPTTTAPAPRVLTLGYGDAAGAYRMQGCLVNKLMISGAYGSPLRFSCDLIGQQVDPLTVAGLADRTVNVVMGHHGAVYVDAFGGTVGGTAIPSTAWAFEYTLELNRVLKGYIGGLVPGDYAQPRWKAMLKLSLEFNATSKVYLDAILAAAPALYQRLVRLDFDNTANRELRIDLAGTAAKAPEVFSDRDGVSSVDLELNATYDPGAYAGYTKVFSTSDVSALP